MKSILDKRDKGQAGLDLLLSVIIMLFLTGFLISIFAIMGGEMEEETWEESNVTFTNSTSTRIVSQINETTFREDTNPIFDDITGPYTNCRNFAITKCNNATGDGVIAPSNYTVNSNCTLIAKKYSVHNATLWNCTGTFKYDQNTTASNVISDTSGELVGATDWFGIIIVITAMVVLILLTVVIINAIRGSGLIGGETRESGGLPSNVPGSA